jgi:hypothetical protein
MALEEAVASKGREQLLEELDRHRASLGDLRDRDGPIS